MDEYLQYNIRIYWQRGLSAERDGWQYEIRAYNGKNISSGPHDSLLQVLEEVKEHLQSEYDRYKLILSPDDHRVTHRLK